MANYIYSASFATPTAVTASGSLDATNYPLANVSDYTHPFRVWKCDTLTSGTSSCILNFGAATTLVALVIDNINVAAVKVQYSTNGTDWTDTPGATTVSLDLTDGRYKAYVALSSWTYQYLRVLANTSTSTDGGAYFTIGSLLPLTAITTMTQNLSGEYSRQSHTAVDLNDDFTSGTMSPLRLGDRTCTITVSGPVQTNSSAVLGDLFTLGGTYHAAQPFVFYRNQADTSEVYIVRRIGDVTISQPGPNHVSVGQVILREVV